MQGIKSARSPQPFLSIYAAVRNTFNLQHRLAAVDASGLSNGGSQPMASCSRGRVTYGSAFIPILLEGT